MIPSTARLGPLGSTVCNTQQHTHGTAPKSGKVQLENAILNENDASQAMIENCHLDRTDAHLSRYDADGPHAAHVAVSPGRRSRTCRSADRVPIPFRPWFIPESSGPVLRSRKPHLVYHLPGTFQRSSCVYRPAGIPQPDALLTVIF
jgi:hypothetical protein